MVRKRLLTVVALYAWLLAEMRGDDIDFGGLGADEAEACFFVPIDSAESWAEVAVPEVGIGCRLFP